MLEDAVDQAAGREVLDLVEDEPLAADDPALADVEHLHRRLQLVLGEADDVEVLGRSATICWRSIARRTVARRSRTRAPSRTPAPSPPRASRVEALDDRLGVAVEEVAQLVDQLAVRHLVDLADARTRALLDVVQQARPAEALVLAELGRAAGADRERAQQLVERVADGVGVGVGAEVAGALALAAAHHQRPRPLLVDGHGEERVALVVAEPDVEAGSCSLINEYSSISASTSLRTVVHSTDSAVATIWAVRGCMCAGSPK